MNVTIADIERAQARIQPYIHRTPLMTSQLINRSVGCELIFKTENLQKIGAFKARGACNALFSKNNAPLERGVITHSSGNHGAALAWAAQLRQTACCVVMPRNAPAVKKDAVASYGAEIVFCEPSMASREATLAALIAARGSELVHPYDDNRIIAGQGTAALEILEQLDRPVDILMTPVGGGGLLSGSAIAVKDHKNRASTLVIGAEPEAADDAWRGFKTGIRVTESTPSTIADGLRGTLGERNFKIIMHRVDDILLASETRIIEAMRLLWTRLKILVEPSAAVPLAAIMQQPDQFSGKRVAIVLSGGNLDLDALPW